MLPYIGLDILVPARETDECLRLTLLRLDLGCYLPFDKRSELGTGVK